MRFSSLLTIGVFTVTTLAAQNLLPVSKNVAERSASADPRSSAIYNGPRTPVAMWIWTDKVIYSPNDSVTLRWTVKPNGDFYPYTVFVYEQYNKTGAKRYFPGGGSDPVDIQGNTLADGFQPMQIASGGDIVKQVVSAVNFSAPSEPGMHTFVVQLRDYTGTHVIKTAYTKFSVVVFKKDLSGEITSNMTLTSDTEWDLKGLVLVKNATLTIEPGTYIVGQPGSQPPSALVITTSGKIMAKGTRAEPIVMTSSQPVGERTWGDWGGLIMMGKAPINVLANSNGKTNPAGSFFVEGVPATDDTTYGGTDPKHNCGTLEYVRLEYAGSIFGPNNEINNFTFAGCGTDTVLDHLQSKYGLDDAFEWFGGTVNAKYLVGGLIRDDYTDFQLGWVGKLQHAIMYKSKDFPGNRGIEGDNNEYTSAALPTPFSSPTFYNVTYVGAGDSFFDDSNSPGLYLRFGVTGSFNNLLVTDFRTACLQFPDADTQGQVDKGLLKINGLDCWNNNASKAGNQNTLAGQIDDAYTLAYAQGQKGNGAGKNILVANPMLTRPQELSDPDWTPLPGSPVGRAGWVQPPDDGFFDQNAHYLGAFSPDGPDWTEEWTDFKVEDDIAVP